jgi:hypothetical protein
MKQKKPTQETLQFNPQIEQGLKALTDLIIKLISGIFYFVFKTVRAIVEAFKKTKKEVPKENGERSHTGTEEGNSPRSNREGDKPSSDKREA